MRPLLIKNCLAVGMSLLFMIGFFTGCAHLFPPPDEDIQARRVLELLAGNNSGLMRFKALAHVRLESDGQIVSGRVAMAAIVPDKLRIEWLNMMGQPLTSLSGDGKVISIISHTVNKVHQLRQSAAAMETLIHIPIGIEDLQKIVIGRIPLPADSSVQFKERDNQTEILVLKNRWHNVSATIRVDRSSAQLLGMKAYSSQGALLYDIQWLRWRTEGSYTIPAEIIFQSESGDRLNVTTDRFWPDAEVPESIFTLNIS